MEARELLGAEASVTAGGMPMAFREGIPHGSVRTAIAWLEKHALIVAAIATVAGVILATSPSHINQDGWLALVDGRYVAQHGIPHSDGLAILTHGARWIDQQWLAQLAIYALALTRRVPGLKLFDIKCAWFNEHEYLEIFPRTLFTPSPSAGSTG